MDMPYKDKSIAKEYHNTWQQKKRASLNKGTIISKKSDIVSKEQLSSLKKIKTWEGCIEAANKLIVRGKTNRLEVAALAFKACEIIHGGNRRSKDYIKKMGMTVTKFANDLKIHPRTLQRWMQLKKFIDEDKSKKPINLSQVNHLMQFHKKTDYHEVYKYFEKHPEAAKISTAIKYISGAVFIFKKYGIAMAHPTEKEILIKKYEELTALLYILLYREKVDKS